MNTIAERVLQLTLEGLASCPPAARKAFELVHGFDSAGDNNAGMSTKEASEQLNVSHSTIRASLNHARATVYRHISIKLVSEIHERDTTEVMFETVGNSTTDINELGVHYRIIGHTGQHTAAARTVMGEGSEAISNAEKRGDRSATLRLQQQYTHQKRNTQ